MIDVLVSAYKQEKFLSKCLDSILDQNINCNIILINPKPSEEYLEIVDNYKEHIKTFIHEKDEGCADGLNKAIPHLLNNYSIVKATIKFTKKNCCSLLSLTFIFYFK